MKRDEFFARSASALLPFAFLLFWGSMPRSLLR
jgi:hypothetical protein